MLHQRSERTGRPAAYLREEKGRGEKGDIDDVQLTLGRLVRHASGGEDIACQA